jgi:diaminopimelate decarboxylase
MQPRSGKANDVSAGSDSERRLPLVHWGLRVGARGLQAGSRSLADIADRHGTPFYLFDEERLRTNARRATDDARSVLPGSQLLYSLKTNPHKRVMEILVEEGLGAEAISANELRAALDAGVSPSRMVLNGPGKSDEDLSLAIQQDVLVQVESASEAASLASLASLAKRTARAGIRVNPDVFEEAAPQGVRMGSRGSVFGMAPEGREFANATSILSEAPFIRLESLSAHIGTGIISSEPFRRLARTMVAVLETLADRGIRIPVLDLGGGFPVVSECRYSVGSIDELGSGGRHAVPEPGEIASFRQICEAVASEVGGAPPVTCVLEPGRLLVSDAFHLVTRVIRIKEESGTRFAIVDAGRVQNALFVGRGYHEIIHVGGPNDPAGSEVTITGPLCADFDVFVSGLRLPELTEGDLLAVLDVGAYNLSAQSSWSFEPAHVIGVPGATDSSVPVD